MWLVKQKKWLRVTIIAGLSLILSMGLLMLRQYPATATIRITSEGSTKTLIQSRHSLKDKQGNSWQVILFDRSSQESRGDDSFKIS